MEGNGDGTRAGTGHVHAMPVVSRFLGISIEMYYREHAPPHFHAMYGEHEVTVGILSDSHEGNFPNRALRLVIEWKHLHVDELMWNWNAARNHQPLRPIAGLE